MKSWVSWNVSAARSASKTRISYGCSITSAVNWANSSCANRLFIEPRYTLGFALQDVSGLSLYLLSSFLVIVMGERMRRAHRHAHASAGLAVARQRAVEAEMEERKRAEQAVRQNEERLRTILDSALDAVITIDAQGCVAYWNPQAEKIFGWSKSAAVGKRL